jgi:hypothetical protein
MVNAAEGKGFWPTFARLWQHKMFINGPLWFAQALLLFSLGYCAWRAVSASAYDSERAPRPVPAYRWWLLSAVGVAAAAVLPSASLFPRAKTSLACNSASFRVTSFFCGGALPPGAMTGCGN